MTTVAVHDGTFHADDVFAVATLKLINPEIQVIRTRDEEIYTKTDMRVDIGKKNNPETNDFDHHQQQGGGVRTNGVPYASFGLVWKHFGHKLVNDPKIVHEIDGQFVQLIDGPDCGYSVSEPLEGLGRFGLPELVGTFLPTWQEGDLNTDDQFNKAVEFAMKLLQREIAHITAKFEARTIVQKAIEENPHKEFLVLSGYYPWKKMACENKNLLYVIYPVNERWNVQCVTESPTSFVARKNLPESWAGKDKEELQEITGVKDAIFCHRQRFIAAARSQEGALQLVKLALE